MKNGRIPTSYEPYGASPSPDYPSEIHSVANDVNLFDISKITTTGAITNNGDGTITITNSYSTSTAKKLSVLAPNLKVEDTYILNIETIGTNKFIYLYGTNESWVAGATRTLTQTDLDSYVFVYGDSNQSVTISGLKIAKSTTLTPCSEYGKGTVTIKQRGKNLFNANANTKQTIQVSNDGATITLNTSSLGGGAVNGDKLSVLAPDLVVGETYKLSLSSSISNLQYIYVGSLWISGTTKTITQAMLDATTVFYSTSNEQVTITNMQIVKENDDITAWEPYRANDYIIQTEPLRSLPNGVKDTIEDDGIHRRVGRVVLNGSEEWITLDAQNTDNTFYVSSTIIDSTAKSGGYILSNIAIKGAVWGTDNANEVALLTNYSKLRFRVSKNIASTVQEWKTYLSNNYVEVVYELETEIIEPLTQNQATTMLDIIKTGSYEGTTNIYTDEDVKPTIGVEYYKKC